MATLLLKIIYLFIYFLIDYVKDYFKHLERGNLPLVPIKMLWNPCVPTKVSFFSWEAWLGKMLTMEQSKKRGNLASRYPFCRKYEEGLEHIMIHCQ